MRLRTRFIACLMPALYASGCLDDAGSKPAGEDVGFRNKVWTTPPGDYAPVAVGYHWIFSEIDSSGEKNYTTHADSMAKTSDLQIEYEILSSRADPATGDSLYQARERTRELGPDGTLGDPFDRVDSIRVKRDRPAGALPQVILSYGFTIPFLCQYRYLDTSQGFPKSAAKDVQTAVLGSDTLRAYHDTIQGGGFGGAYAWFNPRTYIENVGLFEESEFIQDMSYGTTDVIYSVESRHVRLAEFNGRRFDHVQLRE